MADLRERDRRRSFPEGASVRPEADRWSLPPGLRGSCPRFLEDGEEREPDIDRPFRQTLMAVGQTFRPTHRVPWVDDCYQAPTGGRIVENSRTVRVEARCSG